jgi:hypothetical protein
MVTKHKRTAQEQKFWDDMAKAVGADCLRGATQEPIAGCSRLARSFADAMLQQRRESIAEEQLTSGNHGKQS